MKVMRDDSDMLEEYNFSGGIRGKYASRYKEVTNIIMLEPELMEYFPDSASLNEALRSLANIMKKYKNKKAEQCAQADRQPTVP